MDKKIEKLISLIHNEKIKNFRYSTYGFQKDFSINDNINYGYIPFLDTLNPIFVNAILPDIYKTNRNCEIRENTEFICIHDTLSASPRGTIKMHDNWIQGMANDPKNTNTVSWHFIISDKYIYQHLPLNEIAHHAGDGLAHPLFYTDTEIKADETIPVFSISDDGFYEIINLKTSIKVPLDANGNIPKTEQLPTNGINYIINENGNYSLGNTWFSSTYQKVGNFGGNLNSIGIETCVNAGIDYNDVMRNTARVVAELLIKYNLHINRVKQHNNFSGKDCPMTMRRSNRWDEFIKLVELEKYYLDNFKNIKIKFTSLSPEILDECGRIIKYIPNKEIKYKITFIGENFEKEIILKSVLDNCNF